jgi:uncharacterized protein GlcG (DUF336 family)
MAARPGTFHIGGTACTRPQPKTEALEKIRMKTPFAAFAPFARSAPSARHAPFAALAPIRRMAPIAAMALAAALAAGAASAQAVRSERNMSLELANRLAADTVAACTAGGYQVSAAVVDRAGQLRALQRADNAGPHTLASAQAKAYTSASAKNTTLAMMDNAQKNPAAANLVHMPGFLLLGGGVPVKAGNEVIGAIGVGGAPGGHLDEQCATAALDKAKDLLK